MKKVLIFTYDFDDFNSEEATDRYIDIEKDINLSLSEENIDDFESLDFKKVGDKIVVFITYYKNL